MNQNAAIGQRLFAWLRDSRRMLGAGLATLLILAVLAPGFQLASQLTHTASAIRVASEERRHPRELLEALRLVRDRLASRGYLGDGLSAARTATANVDASLERLSSIATSDELRALRETWSAAKTPVAAILKFEGTPYTDDEVQGTQLTKSGAALAQSVRQATVVIEREIPRLEAAIGDISARLERRSAELATRQRLLMAGGLIGTLSLGLVMLLLIARRDAQERRLRLAESQMRDILATTRDGLFLLGDDLRLSGAHSKAMLSLFQRDNLANLKFEELLKPLVSEKTLETATKFVKLLWSPRTKENLVRSINPLGEVEVYLPRPDGSQERHFLAFDFHRVRGEGDSRQVLVSVADVTSRVAVAQELREVQERSKAHVETLLGILHVDPQLLMSFLSESDAALRHVNAIMKEPARDEATFRKKLDGLFRQIHSLKGEGAALGLTTIEARAHEFEEQLAALRKSNSISGNDFLPLVLKLDELLTHLGTIRDVVARLDARRPAQLVPDAPSSPSTVDTIVIAKPPALVPAAAIAEQEPQRDAPREPAAALESVLRRLADVVARDEGKRVNLQARGLDTVPAEYLRTVKDISIQLVRNAIVHGLESPAERAATNKPETGVIRVSFAARSTEEWRLTVEDDGRGIDLARVRSKSVEQRLLSPTQAQAATEKELLSLLFVPGFSTRDASTKHAGRGVGLDVVAAEARAAGGRVGLSSQLNQSTRITVALPIPTEYGRLAATN